MSPRRQAAFALSAVLAFPVCASAMGRNPSRDARSRPRTPVETNPTTSVTPEPTIGSPSYGNQPGSGVRPQGNAPPSLGGATGPQTPPNGDTGSAGGGNGRIGGSGPGLPGQQGPGGPATETPGR